MQSFKSSLPFPMVKSDLCYVATLQKSGRRASSTFLDIRKRCCVVLNFLAFRFTSSTSHMPPVQYLSASGDDDATDLLLLFHRRSNLANVNADGA
ncbi:Membrane progestin receptor gamma [Trichinella spiralis]|uniref:Membrane progestin receptor gamma n=1 Tax=Trichinella spiralis TaxID=6334 RepID=A0ABR3KW47_TRISP